MARGLSHSKPGAASLKAASQSPRLYAPMAARTISGFCSDIARAGQSPSVALEAAKVADEKQMLEVPADRRQALQVLDRLLAASLAARTQRWANELLEQRGLAIGRAHEDAQ